jgi:hypothetical protein
MRLEMATEEAQELKWALDVRLVEMRRELAHTSDHAYRDELKRALLRLEEVVRRLAKVLEDGEHGDSAAIGKTLESSTNIGREK